LLARLLALLALDLLRAHEAHAVGDLTLARDPVQRLVDQLDGLLLVLDQPEHETLVVVVGALVGQVIDGVVLLGGPQRFVPQRPDVAGEHRELMAQEFLVLRELGLGRLRHDTRTRCRCEVDDGSGRGGAPPRPPLSTKGAGPYKCPNRWSRPSRPGPRALPPVPIRDRRHSIGPCAMRPRTPPRCSTSSCSIWSWNSSSRRAPSPRTGPICSHCSRPAPACPTANGSCATSPRSAARRRRRRS